MIKIKPGWKEFTPMINYDLLISNFYKPYCEMFIAGETIIFNLESMHINISDGLHFTR